ncbi:MAG: lipopolysaccharide biosynthesis protein [Clostridia bacterium]|jgi:O-antigen/teichoic acid export membrane protein
MDNEVNKLKVVSSLLWKGLERAGTQGIQFVVQILLARLLLPDDFGIIALVLAFIAVANVFIQNGFNVSLIQKKEVSEADFSSVFYLSILISVLLILILFFVAPLIAAFYGLPQITSVLRVLSLTLILGAFNSIQNAVIARNMQFKKLFFSSLGAIIVSGTIGVTMAHKGFGVWALVVQQITNQLLITGILWFIVKWRPKLTFSISGLKGLFSFGWKLLVASLIDTLYINLRSLIIGKIYNPAALGFYNRGEQFPSIIVSNIDGSIQSVMLPALAYHQEDRQKVKKMVRRSITTSSFIIFPMMIGLAAIAEPMVKILLTDKWLLSVPFLQIFCLAYAPYSIHTANLQAINAIGRSDIFLKLEVVKKAIGIVILAISIFFGIYAIAAGMLLISTICFFINAYPNKSLLNYSYKEQWNDIFPSLLISFAMGLIVYSISFFRMETLFTLIVQVGAGAAIYISSAILFKLKSYTYLITTLRDLLKDRKGEQK